MSWAGMDARYAVAVMAGGALALAGVGVASAGVPVRIVRVPPLAHVEHSRPGNPLMPLVRRHEDTVTSSNWSGYAVQSPMMFTGAEGSWTEPAASCASAKDGYAAFWVGIDGYSSDSVEQLGTDSDCVGKGRPSYYAWHELYPADSVNLSIRTYPVRPGDRMSASVTGNGASYTLTETDATEGWTFSTTKARSGFDNSSAELIAESPEVCLGTSCSLAPFSDFGTVSFTNAEARVSGGAYEPYSSFAGEDGPFDIIAETNSGTIRAQPSGLNVGGNAFSIAWKHS